MAKEAASWPPKRRRCLRLPPVETGNESLRIFIWPGRKLDESVRSREGCEIAGSIGGTRHRPGPAPVIALDADGQKEGQLSAIRYCSSQCHLLGRERILSHGRKQCGKDVPGQAHEGGDRVSGE